MMISSSPRLFPPCCIENSVLLIWTVRSKINASDRIGCLSQDHFYDVCTFIWYVGLYRTVVMFKFVQVNLFGNTAKRRANDFAWNEEGFYYCICIQELRFILCRLAFEVFELHYIQMIFDPMWLQSSVHLCYNGLVGHNSYIVITQSQYRYHSEEFEIRI